MSCGRSGLAHSPSALVGEFGQESEATGLLEMPYPHRALGGNKRWMQLVKAVSSWRGLAGSKSRRLFSQGRLDNEF